MSTTSMQSSTVCHIYSVRENRNDKVFATYATRKEQFFSIVVVVWRQATRKEQFFYRRDGRLMLVSETWQRKTDDRPHERNSFFSVVVVVWPQATRKEQFFSNVVVVWRPVFLSSWWSFDVSLWNMAEKDGRKDSLGEKLSYRRDCCLMLISEKGQRKRDERPREKNRFLITVTVICCWSLKQGR